MQHLEGEVFDGHKSEKEVTIGDPERHLDIGGAHVNSCLCRDWWGAQREGASTTATAQISFPVAHFLTC